MSPIPRHLRCTFLLSLFRSQEPIEDIENDHELLYSVARTSLRTKLEETVPLSSFPA